MQPCSLTTSMPPFLALAAAHRARTMPSTRRPPEKLTSPVTVVLAPIRLPIFLRGRLFAKHARLHHFNWKSSPHSNRIKVENSAGSGSRRPPARGTRTDRATAPVGSA